VKQHVIQHNLRIDRIRIRSELRYLIGSNIVRLKCRVSGGKTGTIAMVRVFVYSNPFQWSGSGLELDREPNREFGTIGNTSHSFHKLRICHPPKASFGKLYSSQGAALSNAALSSRVSSRLLSGQLSWLLSWLSSRLQSRLSIVSRLSCGLAVIVCTVPVKQQ